MIQKFIQWISSPVPKNALIFLFPLGVEKLFDYAITLSDSSDATLRIVMFVLTAILVIFYLVILAIFSKDEINRNRAFSELEKQNRGYTKVISLLSHVFNENSKKLSKTADDIYATGQLDSTNVSLESCCDDLCKHAYDILCEFQLGDDYEVTYVARVDADTVTTLGYYNKQHRHPRVYRVPRSIHDSNAYIDAKRFKTPEDSSNVYLGEDQITNNFVYSTGVQRPEKYKQYVSIPVFCEAQKMVGLLQIVALNNSRIVTSTEQYEYVADSYFTPLSLLFLYIAKMEKAITAVPPLP